MGRACYSFGGTEPYKKISRCSGRRKKTNGQTETKMGRGVMEDARELGERNWRNAARNRDSWQKVLKEPLVQKGLLCNDDDHDDDHDDGILCLSTIIRSVRIR